MSTIPRYIVRKTLAPLAFTTVVVLVTLLLERMFRVMEFTRNTDDAAVMIFTMLVNLVPHYMAMALPAALFVAVLLTFDRLNKDSELAALHALGIGLHQLLVPVLAVTVVVAIVTGAIVGFLQPYGRYAYRATVHAVVHASVLAGLEEGVFVTAGGMTFMAERVARGGRLDKVFLHEEKPGGRSVTTTARHGALLKSGEDLRPVLYLEDGRSTTVEPGGASAGVLTFDALKRPIGAGGKQAFRARGNDESELTSVELVPALARPPEGVTTARIATEFQSRLVRTLSVLVLPLLAIPLGRGSRRGRPSYEIALGLVILVLYQKVLQLGESLAGLGQIQPWLGLWAPFAAFTIGSAYLFFRAGFRVADDPLSALVDRAARPGEWFGAAAPRAERQPR